MNWSTPWFNTLVVNVMGRRVNFRSLEAKLQRSWTHNGKIQIIDLHDGFYQIIFTSQEDYNFALYGG